MNRVYIYIYIWYIRVYIHSVCIQLYNANAVWFIRFMRVYDSWAGQFTTTRGPFADLLIDTDPGIVYRIAIYPAPLDAGLFIGRKCENHRRACRLMTLFRLTEIRDCDCAETIPLGALSREWSPFKGKRRGTCIWHNYEGTPITSTSKRSKDLASLSLIARDVEIHLINDPRARLFLRSWETTLHELVSHFLKTLFPPLSSLSMYVVPPAPCPYLLSRRTLIL